MDGKKMIITIGREFGSGGHEIGEKVARLLNIRFYDKNLIELAADRNGLDAESVAPSDERAPGLFASGYAPTLSDQLFYAQSDLIRSLAETESFVIVGRCANSVLYGVADTLNVFIYAPLHDRIERVMNRYLIENEERARKEISRVDKIRRNYYQYYTEYRWGSQNGHDILINSSMLGIDETAQLIAMLAKKKLGG